MFEIIRKSSKGKQVKKKYSIETLRALVKVSPHLSTVYYDSIKSFLKNLHSIIDTLEDDDIISIPETIDTIQVVDFLDSIGNDSDYLFEVKRYSLNGDSTIGINATIEEYEKYQKTLVPDYYSILLEAYKDDNQDFLYRNLVPSRCGIDIFATSGIIDKPTLLAFYIDEDDVVKLLKHWSGERDSYTVKIHKTESKLIFFKKQVECIVDTFGLRHSTNVPYTHLGDSVDDISYIIRMNHLSEYIDDIIEGYFEEGFLDILRESSRRYVLRNTIDKDSSKIV